MDLQLVATLALSLAIAFSWPRFKAIFSQTTDQAILLSPATTLATTICLAASALALAGDNVVIGGTTVVLGLTFAPALERWQSATLMRLALAAFCLLIDIGARTIS